MAHKCIILLLDGTWNDADRGVHDTNIVRLQQFIAKSLDPASRLVNVNQPAPAAAVGDRMVAGGTFPGSDVEHIVFYERGVGTGALDRFRGGALGNGLEGNIRRAYKFLSHHYHPGDQIFIFGFSRGAYTARSLVGYIAAAGLLKRERCTAEREQLAWRYYRTTPNDRLPGIWAELEPDVHRRDTFGIECVGVFDTVGALGIPLKGFWRLNRERYEFHNVELSSITKLNLHALAVDEHRYPFEATVWRKPKFKTFATVTEQVWFPGAHADIGGSYIDETERYPDHQQALDDIALDWMLKRVKHFYPNFPFDPAKVWRKSVDQGWAKAPGHEARKWIYRVWPFALRMPANYIGRPRGFRRAAVGHDRHADPIAEMAHIATLQRLGERVLVNGRQRTYAPWNLIVVLDAIERTYCPAAITPRTGPDILVVDWSGAPLSPDRQPDRDLAMKTIHSARVRLGLP